MLKIVQLLRELNRMNESERIAKIIESEQMTAKQFATEIGVAASTISNILAERNKPSTDLYVRILNRFRTINTDWLLLGTGSMYRPNGGLQQTSLFGDMRPLDVPEQTDEDKLPKQPMTQHVVYQPAAAQKQIAKIIVYYTDGTYEER